jgi:hypothetical protein
MKLVALAVVAFSAFSSFAATKIPSELLGDYKALLTNEERCPVGLSLADSNGDLQITRTSSSKSEPWTTTLKKINQGTHTLKRGSQGVAFGKAGLESHSSTYKTTTKLSVTNEQIHVLSTTKLKYRSSIDLSDPIEFLISPLILADNAFGGSHDEEGSKIDLRLHRGSEALSFNNCSYVKQD